MICPNCGAIMEQHVFSYICSYCGCISKARDAPARKEKGKEENLHFYEYIFNNLPAIQRNLFVDIVQKQDYFECKSSKPFYPNDGHYTLDQTLAFWWYAKVTKQGINISLLVKTNHTDAQNHIYIKVGSNLFTFEQQGIYMGMLVFPMLLDDFLLFTTTSDFEIDTNMYDKACHNNYQEFVTYTRRFYNVVIDASKYRYSIDIKLLTDKKI